MKKQLLTVAIALSQIGVHAEISHNDSIDSSEITSDLQEIVIEAPKVIRKADMDVYIPSKKAIENSKNGMQLLSNLMIPALNANDILGTVKAAGQNVQIRINGREASIDMLRSLLPETIKKVEWIDNPGLRYEGASYVLNFIVSNPTAGGSLMTLAIPALNVAWGQYRADLKFNIGRSQWQIGGNYKLTNRIKTYRDYTETFTYPDGSSLKRDETTLTGSMDYPMSNVWASYNYIKPDTTVFIVEFSIPQILNDKLAYNGLLSLSDGSEDVLLSDTKVNKGTTPRLSLYFQQNFGKMQSLVISLNSSYYSGQSYTKYMESRPSSTAYITDIYTDIRDRNQAYAAEADYMRHWDNSRLTAGVSWQGNRNRSEYKNLGGEIFHQRQDNFYFYTEYFRRFNRWTATAGIGAQYTEFRFTETTRCNHTWNPRPKISVTYSPNGNNNLYIDLSSWQTTPTLAETNIAPQQIDGFQWLTGNQDLKAYNTYRISFRYAFNIPHMNGTFGISGMTSPGAVAPTQRWEDTRLLTTYENSTGKKQISFSFSPQIEIIPNWLNASGTIRYNIERTRGTGYECHYNDWDGNCYLQIAHWGFILTGQYSRENRSLRGERITRGESFSVIDLTYNLRNWQFCAGVMMPFGKYDRGTKSLNKWNSNEQHIRLDMRIPYIQIAYNLQWGRQKRRADRLINIDAEADKSSAAGR